MGYLICLAVCMSYNGIYLHYLVLLTNLKRCYSNWNLGRKTLDPQLIEVSDAATLPPDGLRRALSSVYNAQRFKVGLLVKTVASP